MRERIPRFVKLPRVETASIPMYRPDREMGDGLLQHVQTGSKALVVEDQMPALPAIESEARIQTRHPAIVGDVAKCFPTKKY